MKINLSCLPKCPLLAWPKVMANGHQFEGWNKERVWLLLLVSGRILANALGIKSSPGLSSSRFGRFMEGAYF